MKLTTLIASFTILTSSIVLANVLVCEDFERPKKESLGLHLVEHRHLEIVDGVGVDDSRGLKASYVGYDRGSERIVSKFDLPLNGERMSLCYDVMFDENFQFVGGGKLLGLGPVNTIDGGRPSRPDGWSARLNFTRGGGIRTYLYEQDKKTRWGLAKSNPNFRFEKGRYYSVSFFLTLNNRPDASNGSVEVYVDGDLLIKHENLRFRATTLPDSNINQFQFNTFHGGSSPKWAPKDEKGNYVTVHAYFDNIAIYEDKHVRTHTGMID